MSLDLTYRMDFRCNDSEPLQAALNTLCSYEHDLETKVLHRGRLNLFHTLMDRLEAKGLLASKKAALDVGCNSGIYSKLMSDRGYRLVEGVDIEPELIRRAQDAFSLETPHRTRQFRVQDAETLSGTPRYDLILCSEVIEHTRHPERVIANIRALLKPDGIGILSLPNACSFPYVKAALKYRLTRRARDPVFEDHLRYPFWKSMTIYSGTELSRVLVCGANLFWDATTLRWLHGTPVFEPLNRLQFHVTQRLPFAFVAQFFFVVFRKRGTHASISNANLTSDAR